MKYQLLSLSELEGYFIVESEHYHKAMRWEECEWDTEGYKDTERQPSWPSYIHKYIREVEDFTFDSFESG